MNRLDAIPLSVQARNKENEQRQKGQEEHDTGGQDGESGERSLRHHRAENDNEGEYD